MRVVPDVAVAARAGELALARVPALDGLRHVLMAGAARALRDLVVELVDADGLVEPADGEVERMPETVARLGVVLADQIMRRVTVVAARDRAMSCRFCFNAPRSGRISGSLIVWRRN